MPVTSQLAVERGDRFIQLLRGTSTVATFIPAQNTQFNKDVRLDKF